MLQSEQPIAQKLQLRFTKTGAMRFLSHHDLMRLFARACRRAALPVRLTQGFDPRPRLVFATALELGIESRAEFLEVELARWIPLDRVASSLGGQLPEGIGMSEARLLPPRRGGMTPVEASYAVRPPGGTSVNGISPERTQQLMNQEELIFERHREKRVQVLDLRPSIVAIEVGPEEVLLRLRPTGSGFARPSEVLAMLSGKPLVETKRWQTVKTSMQMAP